MPHKPLHERATAYAKSGLFTGLGSFSELERRIEQLPGEQQRGEAFEVFVEAYLNNDNVAQAKEVWVVGKVPAEIRRRLNLPAKDYGYDGVFQTGLGELVPYQAKFRTARASLPYAELATFLGISEKADRRVVLTNSIAISEVAGSRSNFQTTRGGDFDRLDSAQLTAIAAWLQGIKPEHRVREPRPYQLKALTDIAGELATHDRATVVMACGTGKTLVALWAAEKAQARRILVLLPSLNLVRQTLHEWAKWTSWGERFRYLCVCSDPKVAKGIDEIEIRPEDADFPVRTDPGIVKRFLNQGVDAVSVVFCTYQSAPVVGEAMKGRQPFDLGIFDEAHKTTGREGTRYAFALRDKNLPIRKRLFLTATPRHYDIRKRDKEGDFAVVSMDNEALYGREAHRLTFAQAAEQKIIVPYKVVISVVDSEMIDNALMDQSEVSIKGDPVRAKWVAHQIALTRAVEEHNLKRLITFHSSIKAAAAFASNDSEGVGFHLPNFQRFHVSGVQPTAERDEHMREFEQARRGVITNARCLTEGVDVPSVDMVAFMNPRRSKVDIVQAVGRAMRAAGEEKTCGYVLVPLFLETRKGETLDEAIKRSDFDEIVQVLNAMRDNDYELSELIEALSVDQGRVGGFDESRLRDKVEVIGPQIQLSELAASIRALLIEELGITWDKRYGELIAYKEKHGHCDVPNRWKENPRLASWCNNQRQLHRTRKLSSDRIKRLEELGFVWNVLEASWEEMFSALTAYKEKHGDCNASILGSDRKLGVWVTVQRKVKKDNKLTADRVKRLELMGFDWDPLNTQWQEMFRRLLAFKTEAGDCNVPQGYKDKALAYWVNVQRQSKERDQYEPNRAKQLDAVGFDWNPNNTRWEQQFQRVVEYKNEQGNLNIPATISSMSLETWIKEQRRANYKGRLEPHRFQRLDALGFEWNPVNTYWEEMFRQLVTYKRDHGNCSVPITHPNGEFARWVSQQRTSKKQNKLDPDREKRLEELGFVWERFNERWEEQFDRLVAYKNKYGDCDVPFSHDDVELAVWVATQRTRKRQNKLAADRQKRLTAIGFNWQIIDLRWETMFERLMSYKREHGDCNVPQAYQDKALGVWVGMQRVRKRRGKLDTDYIKRLVDVGFDWEYGSRVLDEHWQKMFAALVAYRDKNGNCTVPRGWKDNPQLASWCIGQRQNYKKGKLSSKRIKRLEKLGFVWKPPVGRRSSAR